MHQAALQSQMQLHVANSLHTVGTPVTLRLSGLGWCVVGSSVQSRHYPPNSEFAVINLVHVITLVMACAAPTLGTNAVIAWHSSLHSHL